MPKAERPKYNYPFQSKAQILARQSDLSVALEHLAIINGFQTTDEQGNKVTKYKNRSGFMSSHAANGTRICEKHAAGEPLTDDEVALARKIAGSYGRQLALHFRELAIEANPELAKIAEIFSAGPRAAAVETGATES
jgi:hypothetical protein